MDKIEPVKDSRTELVNMAKGRLPRLEDGCVIGSQKCVGETIICDTCKMPLCEEHMSRKEHLMDCHYRLGLEKKGMKEMQKRHKEELQTEQHKKEALVISKVLKDTGKVMSYEQIIVEQQKKETEERYRKIKEVERRKEVAKNGKHRV